MMWLLRLFARMQRPIPQEMPFFERSKKQAETEALGTPPPLSPFRQHFKEQWIKRGGPV